MVLECFFRKLPVSRTASKRAQPTAQRSVLPEKAFQQEAMILFSRCVPNGLYNYGGLGGEARPAGAWGAEPAHILNTAPPAQPSDLCPVSHMPPNRRQ